MFGNGFIKLCREDLNIVDPRGRLIVMSDRQRQAGIPKKGERKRDINGVNKAKGKDVLTRWIMLLANNVALKFMTSRTCPKKKPAFEGDIGPDKRRTCKERNQLCAYAALNHLPLWRGSFSTLHDLYEWMNDIRNMVLCSHTTSFSTILCILDKHRERSRRNAAIVPVATKTKKSG
ncbi:hypothetical protein Leryth_027400 [Lithospermum erythrorhizon]|nr:hypothetical protein Leryth_027400 [Lithospermum erythrorhizon]